MRIKRCKFKYKIIRVCKGEEIKMTTMEGNILDLQNLIQGNIGKAIELAKKSSKYNDRGEAVLSKDDEWREDNEWNNYYDQL